MAKFLVQVVLHDVGLASMYDGLNKAMRKKGFVRELPGKKASYHLPLGTFWYEGNISSSDLRTTAGGIAEDTGLDFGVVVVRVDGWSVMRLKKVEAAPRG
jgi:hypothetical protein